MNHSVKLILVLLFPRWLLDLWSPWETSFLCLGLSCCLYILMNPRFPSSFWTCVFICLLVIITWLTLTHIILNLSIPFSSKVAELENSLGICIYNCLLDIAIWISHRCLRLMFVNLSPLSLLSSFVHLVNSCHLILTSDLYHFLCELCSPCQYLLS